MKVIVTNNITSFVFKGQLSSFASSSYNTNYYDSKDMSLRIEISDFQPGNYQDLIMLNDTILHLDNPEYGVSITIDENIFDATVLGGEIEFKRAQYLYVDKKQVELILSGVFDFQALVNNEPISITNGRFDMGISEDNFYKY